MYHVISLPRPKKVVGKKKKTEGVKKSNISMEIKRLNFQRGRGGDGGGPEGGYY